MTASLRGRTPAGCSFEERSQEVAKPGREKGFFQRYGSAVAAVILATLLRMLLDPLLEQKAPFTTYFVAIVFTAWYAGLGPSLAVIVSSGILGAISLPRLAAPWPLLTQNISCRWGFLYSWG